MLLTPAELARARRVNYIIAGQEFPSGPPLDWPQGITSSEFALRTAYFQKRFGLSVDGIFGPRTHTAYDDDLAAPRPENYLIAWGERFPVNFPVVTWEQDPSWSLYRYRETKPRGFDWRKSWYKADLFVLHWDVALSSRSCHTILGRRGVSVHLMLDADGTVYQALDLAFVRAFHAGSVGGANKRSAGVEINNPYYLKYDPERPTIRQVGVNGNPTAEHRDFYPIQKTRVVELADAVSEILSIPRRVPKAPEFSSSLVKAKKGGLVPGLLSAPASFSGTAGHFHFAKGKMDPGRQVFEPLIAAGW